MMESDSSLLGIRFSLDGAGCEECGVGWGEEGESPPSTPASQPTLGCLPVSVLADPACFFSLQQPPLSVCVCRMDARA